ncbi:ferrous iron transport protein B [uncultured Ruminococcus sp.]|uniref:ferrous iron transport protein B n=1 Tax=uncultured Ruminococcus sp. TaxID=165186 RepID=UPI000EC1CF57|nr:ferrous iron transport protein B [uncultured Ruminococcus sp.]HCJ96365.1 ferrous iron transport protein B [Oscillospiraceae bacterium]
MEMDKLKPKQSAFITRVGGDGALRHHLLDMGLTPGTEITLQKIAPMGDPIQIEVRGYELTLRLDEAKKIEIENIHERKVVADSKPQRHKSIPHPRVGELGEANDYHIHDESKALPKDSKLTFALAGNQNCGKTTLFNQLTGANQHVGNFPGVTVDRKDGTIKNHPEATVTDLPGIYSLSPYSSEEIVTRDFLIKDKPSGIINIVDASNLERNLCLTMQLMELGIPMVLALNMMDEVRENGGSIRVNELEQILGIPVIPISAVKNEGIDELVSHALHVARFMEKPGRIDFCTDSVDKKDPVGAVHRCIHAVVHMIEPEAKQSGLPLRFAATKLIENDVPIEKLLNLTDDKKQAFEHIVSVMEDETGLDREAAISNMRFSFIEKMCQKTVVRPHESKEHKRSMKIDRLLTGRYTAIPCFIAIMALIFVMTFNLVGAWLSDLMSLGVDSVISLIDNALTAVQINPVVHSLVVDGICNGVGSVISFLPTIVTLFFFLSILEDTGYMARVAFVMDKLLRKIGLSGRSFVPMLIGFGCSVPAIMSTRTLSSERDRKMTILLTPFMSCSAKLPIYSLIISVFFPRQYQALVMVGLYIFGIICAIIYALILKSTKFKGEPVPFVMELPNYRLPSAKSVVHLIWEKAKGFIEKAFTIIFVASIIIWFLQTFDARFNVAESPEQSLLAMIGSLVAPIFAPLGFGDWRVSTALITGFTAKESVVSTLTVLMGGDAELVSTLFTPFTAAVFLVFTLLYTPCVAAIATVRREMGGTKAAVATVIIQCAIAWCVAFLIHAVGLAFGLA